MRHHDTNMKICALVIASEITV